ncbi:ribonuclease P protein component 3 [Methanobacterium sp. ACI-7]|uniref:ribonuclease P protein component 3 n=1 Tax=unclassified Methanobacterium TaxID=2627676 RepID=UPI0039C0BF7C
MYFDFHIHGDISLANEAKRLGYNGIAWIQSSKNYNNDLFNNIDNNYDDFSIFKGIEIYAKNPEDLRKKVNKFRDKVDVVIVNGGNLKINRAACEDPRIDILAHPYKNRRDSGINHVLAKKAFENEVAIELSINPLLKTRLSLRAKLLSQFRHIIKLQRKFNFPILISSNAHSIYDLRTPEDIIAISKCFGMTDEEAVSSLSKSPVAIAKRNKIRKDVIVKGVRIINNNIN